MRLIILFLILMLSPVTSLNTKAYNHNLKTDYLRRKADDPEIPWQIRVECLDSLIKLQGKNIDHELFFKKGDLLEKEDHFNEALQTYRDAEKVITNKFPSQYCRLLREKSRMCVYTRSYTEGLESASAMAMFNKPDSLEQYTFYGHMLLIDLFRSLRNTGAANRYLQKAREDLKKLKRTGKDSNSVKNYLAAIYRNDAMLRMDSGNLEGVWEDIVKARELASDSIGKMNATCLLGSLCMFNKETEQAEYYYRQVLNQKINHPNTLATATDYALMTARSKSPEEARAIFEEYRPILEKLKGGSFHNLYYRILYYIDLKEGNYKGAIDNLEKAYRLNDSIHKSQHRLNTAMVADKYEYEQQATAYDTSQEAGRMKSLAIVALSLLMAMSIALIVVVIRRHKKTEVENNELQTKIDNLDREHSKEIQETQINLDERNRELSTMALAMARIEESINEIQALTINHKIPKGEALNSIGNIIKTLKVQNKTWEIFKERFEEVNPKFFEKLYTVCPKLTNNEIRMASFILMNLPMNTIADMTNRSVRTVGTIRYMVRRKLGITGNAETWMMKLNMADEEELLRLRTIAEAANSSSETES